MNFINAKTLIEICENENIKISEAMLRRETEISGDSRENIVARMKRSLDVMRESVAEAGNTKREMLGGFIGGESAAMLRRIREKGSVAGLSSLASAYAMGVLEVNASMGRIVAAPTAGASGVLPF